MLLCKIQLIHVSADAISVPLSEDEYGVLVLLRKYSSRSRFSCEEGYATCQKIVRVIQDEGGRKDKDTTRNTRKDGIWMEYLERHHTLRLPVRGNTSHTPGDITGRRAGNITVKGTLPSLLRR